jgi:hypothetical protein
VKASIGRAVLVLSGLGFPLTQVAISRFGRRGAGVVEMVSLGLLLRDGVMIARGAPGRLRRFPAVLLRLETVAAAVAAVAGARLLIDRHALTRAASGRPDAPEGLRRAAVGTLFGLHTYRFWIFLQPDHGRARP